MKKLYVNGELVATNNYVIEEIDAEPTYTVEIEQDDSAEYPFEHHDIFTLYSNHRRFNPNKRSFEELFNEEGNLPTLEQLNSSRSDYEHFRIYTYQHDGMTVSATPFSCPFDSGLLGIVAVKKKDVSDPEKAFEDYVKTLDQYLQGDVYGVVIKDEMGEVVDSCWGFYGHDDETCESMLEWIPNEYGIYINDVKTAMEKLVY